MVDRNLVSAILVLSLHCSMLFATPLMPTYAPMNRLIANTAAFVEENPKHAHGYYTLGRIHYFAFANGAPFVRIIDPKMTEAGSPKLSPDWDSRLIQRYVLRSHATEVTLREFGAASVKQVAGTDREKFWETVKKRVEQLSQQGWNPRQLSEDELANHAAAAVQNFGKAIKLAPANGLYYLGWACVLEEYTKHAKKTGTDKVPVEFEGVDASKLASAYYTAYGCSVAEALKHTHKPGFGGLRSLVGYEAGMAYLRIAGTDKAIREAEGERVRRVRKTMEKLDNLPPPKGVSPVVFHLVDHTSLRDLLAPALQVSFDLDGDGNVERWPWVKPTTGILVWDPDGRGNITSGRQLFGSVTWWLFFEDGYHALDALDDNRDGALAGAELDGICVWFDRDSDGKSDPGEVRPVSAHGIASLATRATGQEQGCPMSSNGLTLSDGRTLPTYDWIASPIESSLHSREGARPPAP